ncbi:ankyrin repeat protein [Pochonia chlamydosporia 170]|uniref:Ankyrin repeat protein n=1 Tax=Pochonia chlamydosporia 170 TaxID=1380566 RepID=A0A179FPP4_METCM|nr:ankyrin repeat protein [Pochonia chlamydosporia 170]OAQ67200.2 ankyrin repeat protein [Pochonia chlamydosporia 170]
MMLDEEHKRFKTPDEDENLYHFGSINGHNVVIANPPAAGNSWTAVTAKDMKRTFTNLKYALLVGIAGGMPVATASGAIRLGHVVVGIPTGTQPGAIRYDHGKSKPDGGFVLTGCLAPPPTTLLQAVKALAAQPRTATDPVWESVQNIIDQDETGQFRFPGREVDHLYHPDYIHQREKRLCYGETGACDPKQIIERPMVEDVSSVVVHTGTIGTGDTVMRNAKQRDDIAQKYGVLCIEMEAEGLAKAIPCLVIRGISDYCDSHKNDVWHGYAAACAAAYARQLFFVLPNHEAERREHRDSGSRSPLRDQSDPRISPYVLLTFVSMLDTGLRLCSLGNQIPAGLTQGEGEQKVKDCLESWNRSRDVLHHAWLSSLKSRGEESLHAVLQAAVDDIQMTSMTLNEEFGKLYDRGKPGQKDIFKKLEGQLRRYQCQLTPLITQSMFPNHHLLNERMKDGFEQASTNVARAVSSRLDHDSTTKGAKDEDEKATSFGRCVFDYDKMVVESLNFDILHHREDDISNSQPQTLTWLLGDPSGEATPDNNVRLFLRRDLGPNEVAAKPPKSIFYINGKAGSGKSTSMKALCTNDKVEEDIKTWAGNSHVLVSRFYFWYRGTDLQKSQRGMLRALLYQCLSKQRFLIPLTIPQDAELDTPTKARQYWSLNNLKRAFNQMLTHDGVGMNLKFCFFIDGLDEYAADADTDYSNGLHASIGDLLMEIARHPHVKICVSSRPEPPFETIFKGCPGFKLQDKTTDDIREYVQNQLGTVKTLHESQLKKIEESLIKNAEGVFLWVALATKSLLEGINEHASPDRWMEILNELPRGLENFYMHMLTKADEGNQGEGLGYLLLVKAANGNIPLQRLAYVAACDARSKGPLETLVKEKAQLKDAMKTRIQVCCKGLLEIGDGEDVTFLHKSVPDFLESSKLAEKRAAREVNWVAEHQLLDGYVFMLTKLWPNKPDHSCWEKTPTSMLQSDWVERVKPILHAYMRTAQRALQLGKPVPNSEIAKMYKAADDLWIHE